MNTTTRLPSLFGAEPFAFDDAWRSFMRPLRWEGRMETPQFPLDVAETDESYTVKAMIPGVAKDDIKVEIDGRQVTITAEFKKPPQEKKDARMLVTECSYGFASRSFTLGYEVDRAKAVARYTDGVLMLMLPKMVGSRGQTLKVE